MKAKLNISLPAAAVMLFMLSMTGYAMPSHSGPDATRDIALEHPDKVTLGDKANLGPEVTGIIPLENPDGVKLGDKAKIGPEVTRDIPLGGPDGVTLGDKGKLGSEVIINIAVENPLPPSETATTKDSLVSKWLETRATEEAVVHEAGNGKSSFEAVPLPMEEMGGGWCNDCGCWLRHGCDSNGTCNNGHYEICPGQGLSCSLHSGNCVSNY